MKRPVIVAVALGAVVGAYLYWTSDARQIRRLLDGVTDAVSQEEGSGGVAALAEVTSLTRYLAPDITFEPGEPFAPITGAENIVSTVGRLRAVMRSVQLEMTQVQIDVAGASATVHAMGRLTLRDREGTESLEARDVVLQLEKRDGGWRITSVRARTL